MDDKLADVLPLLHGANGRLDVDRVEDPNGSDGL
jgi:hypothetical protein